MDWRGNSPKLNYKMKDRIHAIMTHLGLSQQDFAARLDLSSSSISNIFNGRTNPTIMHVNAIHRAFPQINEKWLLFGEGEMIESENTSPSSIGGITILNDDDDDAALGNLFDQTENAVPTPPARMTGRVASGASQRSRQRTSNAYEEQVRRGTQTAENSEVENVKNFDKSLRRVKEIRVFYDDNTYETFVPAVK